MNARELKVFFAALSCFSAFSVSAEKQPFERYQSIINRQMFGRLPPGFDPQKLPSEVSKTASSGKELTKEQEKLQKSVHFSVINVAADGTPVVGFSDNSNPKAPVHHYVKVGEESDGWKVVSADPGESTMTIEKDGVELSLKLGDNSGDSSKGAVASSATTTSTRGGRRSPLLGTLGSRRAQREKLRLAQQAEERQKQEDERAQREQEREEQRQQLAAIQEELARQREEKNAAKEKEVRDESGEDNDDQ